MQNKRNPKILIGFLKSKLTINKYFKIPASKTLGHDELICLTKMVSEL